MSDSFQYGDLIFLGLVAVFIALRLRAILGRNTGFDPREAWKQAAREAPQEKTPLATDWVARKPAPAEDVLPAAVLAKPEVVDGLKAIRAADPNFNTEEFVNGAKLAFEWVVGAFAEGDKTKLRNLLAPEPLQHFTQEIDARTAGSPTHENTLVSIEAADITEASLKDGLARITVQFTSEQVHVTRDKDRNVIGGDPSALEKVVDIWTFERNVSSRDPNWKITAT